MRTKQKNLGKINDIWNGFIEQHHQILSKHLSDLEISALSACIGDCYESFYEIYFNLLLKKINGASTSDGEILHECVVDLYWELDHIKNHIIDAQKGFEELMHILAQKPERKKTEDRRD